MTVRFASVKLPPGAKGVPLRPTGRVRRLQSWVVFIPDVRADAIKAGNSHALPGVSPANYGCPSFIKTLPHNGK